MRRLSFLFVIFAFSAIFTCAQKVTQGSLYASGKDGALGECPLRHTSVRADISGFTARVTVIQEFENNFNESIEAVYTFPLSQNGAVDDMTMRIGERTIRGKVMKREEARKVYEQAKIEGKTAALLDQQRPNIFTQSVANILPNDKILIEISYVETLKYEDGQYEFVFPMTVGPRYIPGSMDAKDAKNISPAVSETRNGSDISLEVNLDAGVPTEGIHSISHPITMNNLSANSARISLRAEQTIPNKDFVLRYDVTGKRIEDAVLTHRTEKGGFFSLILSPPEKFTTGDYTPKEIVFVLDTSGSMSGFPIEKAKEAMKLSLEGLNPQDTFNLITFAGDTHILFESPVAASAENLARARSFLESRSGGGGTEMMKAIRAALEPTESQKHLRVVCFMTDGYVGNEEEIIAEIQRHPKARIFSFGIGNSVNRFLLDKMAEEGNGEVEYVTLDEDGSKAAKRFFERVRTPILTDISIDWGNLPVEDIYPQKTGDLFSAKPLVVNGRYKKGARGTIQLKGYVAGKLLVREIPVNLPESDPENDVLATLWARRRVDGLMSDYYKNARNEKARTELQEQITALGIEFRILTQFTSFVAVEDQTVIQNGKPRRVEVPARAPEGMSQQNGQFSAEYGGATGGLVKGTGFTSLMRATPNLRSEKDSRAAGNGDIAAKSEEKKAFNALNVDGGGENSFVIDGQETQSSKTGTVNSNKEAPNTSPVAEVFKRMEQHQKTLKTLQADITVTKSDAASGATEVKQGAVKYMPRAAGDYWLRIDSILPALENFAVVANQYLLYLPDQRSAQTGAMSAEQKTELLIFAGLSKDKLNESFNIKILGTEKLGGTIPTWHLELKPKTTSNYKTVELWIDANGMIIQSKLTERDGDWTSILLTNLQKNGELPTSDFKIELPKETKIIKK